MVKNEFKVQRDQLGTSSETYSTLEKYRLDNAYLTNRVIYTKLIKFKLNKKVTTLLEI